jgi:lysophospholipase L1-like esterase
MRFIMLATLLCAGCGGGGDCSVSIVLNGDSTMWGYDHGVRASVYPELALSQAMAKRFGPGVVKVRTGAWSGSTSTDALAMPRDADIVVYNSGINDVAYGHGESTYWTNMRELAKVPGVVFQTPLPTSTAPKDYADIMRAVAAEAGVPVIDARAWAQQRADWWNLAVDGVHLTSDGYRAMAVEAMMPALEPLVASACAN